VAAYGNKIRELSSSVNNDLKELQTFYNPQIAFRGVLVLQGNKFDSYEKAKQEFENFNNEVNQKNIDVKGYPMVVVVDDSSFTAATLQNWLWVTFTRSNPSHDVYGINSFTEYKHFGCDNLMIDARVKPHHAPALEKVPEIEKQVDKLFEKGGSLNCIK
jgi:4-hydroxy-3-polyprenylbenzoate decarboxylase